MKSKLLLFGVLGIVSFLGGAGISWYERSNDIEPSVQVFTESPSPTSTPVTSDQDVKGAVYANTDYSFIFKYPDGWIQTAGTSGPASRGALNKELVFAVNYAGADHQKNIQSYQCVNNEGVGWQNLTPTKEECAPLLIGLSEEEKRNLSFPPDTLFIRIYKPSQEISLADWLVNHYRIPNSELADYKLGKEIELGGVKGYYSSTGCCAGIDIAYVVKNNGYIYEFGTNGSHLVNDPSDLDQLIEQFSKEFTFFVGIEGFTLEDELYSACYLRTNAEFVSEEKFNSIASGAEDCSVLQGKERDNCSAEILENLNAYHHDFNNAYNKCDEQYPNAPLVKNLVPLFLPPDPGEVGKQTLLGIDSDNDGLRDDVQRWIALNASSSQNIQLALRQCAIAYTGYLQLAAKQGGSAASVDEESWRCAICLTSVAPDGHSQLQDKISDIVFNTIDRYRAYLSTESKPNTNSVLPAYEDTKKSCNFEVK